MFDHDASTSSLLAARESHHMCLCAPFSAGVDSLRGTLPWIAPEVIQHPESVTEAVRASAGL